MWKNIRAAALVMALGLGTTGSAWEGIKVGGDGSVQIGSGGDVSVRGSGRQAEVDVQPSSREEDEAPARLGAQISLEGTGQKQTVSCAKGGEVMIEGTSNSYVIEGECKRISVSGTSNKVRVQAVGAVMVEGTSNVVIWERGLGMARRPTVSTEGVNNKVYQAR